VLQVLDTADVHEDELTIAQAAARAGLPESTLRYWERIGLVRPIERDGSSGHRRYRAEDVATLETLGNLRAVGLGLADMRAYLAGARRGDEAAGEQRALFEAHARRLADEVAALELRRHYLDLKVQYWSAREAGDLDKAAVLADQLGPVIRRMNPKGPAMTTTSRITSPFGFSSTAADVIAGIDLRGRTALVTGAASGIGVETARALAEAGARTVLAARDVAAADRVAADIRAGTGNTAVTTVQLDLLDRASIDRLTAGFTGPLHILVNNAGVMAVPELRLSPEGHELQFATNHLGHFRLAVGLLPALRAAGGARVVAVSSRAHRNSPVVFDDIDFARRPYDPALAYAQSKTATVLFAVAAATRWAGDGIGVDALHPGAIADSNLSRHYDPAVLEQLRTSGRYTYKTLAQGAATSVFVATSGLLDGGGGRYFENCQEADPDDPGAAGTDAAGVARHALDPVAAERLWEISERMDR
jgi:NAD(P)-dependent dehydrogenase (short-subunit alcohol dehydrogenase family)/DNA-binding transcriptional MerR regulator